MLDRALFALRRWILDMIRWLGSWRLSIVLMVVAAFYHALLAIWSASSAPPIVSRIASLSPYWIVYMLLLANTAVCLWNRLPLLRRQVAIEPRLIQSAPSWELETAAEASVEERLRQLAALGYRTRTTGAGVWGVKRRWAPLGTYLFHGAFFLVACGFLLSLAGRRETRFWVTEGEDLGGGEGQVLSSSPPRALTPTLPETTFRVEGIRPEFWGDRMLFTRLEADLLFDGGQQEVTKINRPLWLTWGSFLRLSGFGYAPRWELVDRNGLILDSAWVKMNVFPPGTRDFFVLGETPHQVHLQVYPNAELSDGQALPRGFDLRDPVLIAQVFRGRLNLGKRALRLGEELEFEGLLLRFPEISYWGEFTLVQDGGAPWILIGYLMGLAGLLLKLGGGRREILWRSEGTEGDVIRGWGGPPPFGRDLLPDRATEVGA